MFKPEIVVLGCLGPHDPNIRGSFFLRRDAITRRQLGLGHETMVCAVCLSIFLCDNGLRGPTDYGVRGPFGEK